MPEHFHLDGKNHYSSYLQKKEKYTSTPQDGYIMQATRGSEQTVFVGSSS